ncbi:MAG: type II toxin-antitoxin system Y4mF family antitoxin [Sporichthyaceae bacterium]
MIVLMKVPTSPGSAPRAPVVHDRAQALGAAIRRRRRALRLTQDELADLAGCSRRTVSAVETGKATVRLDVVVALLEVLGLRLRVEVGRGGVVGDD